MDRSINLIYLLAAIGVQNIGNHLHPKKLASCAACLSPVVKNAICSTEK